MVEQNERGSGLVEFATRRGMVKIKNYIDRGKTMAFVLLRRKDKGQNFNEKILRKHERIRNVRGGKREGLME